MQLEGLLCVLQIFYTIHVLHFDDKLNPYINLHEHFGDEMGYLYEVQL